MADYQCWPLWKVEDEVGDNIDPKTLGLLQELFQDLKNWSARYDAQLDVNEPQSSRFFSEIENSEFNQQGLSLWKRLRESLLGQYEVWYFDNVSNEVMKSPTAVSDTVESSRADFEAFLAAVPDVEPDEEDRLD